MKLNNTFLHNTDLGLLLLRITVGGLMLFHGVHKLIHGVDFIEGMLAGLGLPGFLAYASLAAELVIPVLLILGIFTRLSSLIFAGNMLVAILMAHSNTLFSVDPMTGGWAIELPLFYLLASLVLCFTGAGKYALCGACSCGSHCQCGKEE